MINNFLNMNFLNIISLVHIILVICVLFVILFKDKISFYLHIMDYPDSKLKIHQTPTPRLGGLILYAYILPTIILNYIINPTGYKNFIIEFTLLIIFFFIGLVDDRKSLPANNKIFVLLITLFLTIPFSNELIVTQINFKNLNFSISLQHGAIFFTIFSIFALYNAFNFSDGENGVATSLGIFWIIFIIIKSGNYTSFYYQAILISLTIIFYLNIQKKIFLGNSGSNLFSIMISLILIQEYKKNNIFCDEIFFILFLPGIDMIRLTFQRLSNGKSPFLGDNNHLHHLMAMLINKRFIFIAYILICLVPILIYSFLISNFYIVFILSVMAYLMIIFLLTRLKKTI